MNRCDCSPSETEPFSGTAVSRPRPTQEILKEFAKEIQRLLREAEANGVVIRVGLKPNTPLAMGNYEMEAEVYPRFVRD